MEEWTLLKCLKCDFPFLVNTKEYLEISGSDYPFMFCPKCGKEQNITKDCFQEHIQLPLVVKKVTKYVVSKNHIK